MASQLTALTLGFGLLLAPGCDSDPEEPSPEGVYEIEVTGGTDDEFPPVRWNDTLLIEVVAILDTEAERCSAGECWYGNADVKVDGGRPDAAIIRTDREGADLGLVIDPYPMFLEDRSDCTLFAVYAGGFDLRLEGASAEGDGRLMAECIVSKDGQVVDFSDAEFRWQLSGVLQ